MSGTTHRTNATSTETQILNMEEFKRRLQRWGERETAAIAEIRARLGALLINRPQFPEVVGDRKLLRFFKGHSYDVNKTCEMIVKFLKYREEKNVDDIRCDIAMGERNHPSKFPKADVILPLIKSVCITPTNFDNMDCPICVESYEFRPAQVLATITVEEYLLFVMYCLEYRSMVIEQLSEQRERMILNDLKERYDKGAISDSELENLPPYGVICQSLVIRDLKGIGVDHMGAQGREIIRKVVSISADNYPEMMNKCYMINAPFVFNTLWYFIKGLLSQRTVDKVSISGANYMQDLLKRVHAENIPDIIQGGKLREDCIPYVFEIEPGGSLANLNDVIIGSIPQIGEEILLKNDIDDVPPIPTTEGP